MARKKKKRQAAAAADDTPPAPPPQPQGQPEDEAPGWHAIDAAMERLYPDQTNPAHFAPPKDGAEAARIGLIVSKRTSASGPYM